MSAAPQPTIVPQPIRTIFWDLGGVILTNGWDLGQRTRVLGPLGVDLPSYELAHARENWFWERGLMSVRDFFRRTVFDPNPQLKLTFEDLWAQVCAQSALAFPESFELLQQLRALRDLRLATLNNESRELNAYRLDTFNLRPCFDYFLCSGYLGSMKPDPPIFRAAVEISGQPAATSLFIDDKEENCQAARIHGMRALQFQSGAQLRTELQSLGIQLD